MYYKVNKILSVIVLNVCLIPNAFALYENIPVVSTPSITQFDSISNGLHFEVQLTEALPAGFAVFLNVDNQQGDWFVENTPGGHLELTSNTGSTYSLDYTLAKPGLRSVRAGIFDTQNDNDPNNDILVASYSAGTTCTLQACFHNISEPVLGNPSTTGSGSELFKNVDVTNGNYHLSISDLSVTAKGPSFNFTRAYNSKAQPLDNAQDPKTWSFGYEMKARFTDQYKRRISVGPREDGHMQHYFKDMGVDGNPADDEWYTLTPGNFDQLIENTDGSFTLYTQGNRLYKFAVPDGAETGRLMNISNRLGNALTFGYTNNYLTSVKDANDRSYSITRDANNRVSRVTDFSDRYVEYSYDSNNMITAVRNVNGGFDRYTYVGTTLNDRFRLKTITDPRDNLLLTLNYDLKGRVDDVTDGMNNLTDFSYGAAYTNGPQATGIAQPTVDNLNHNRVYILDEIRSKVIEKIDAKNFGDANTSTDIKTLQSYQNINSRTQLAEQSLVSQVTEPNNVALSKATKITYQANGSGKPAKIIDANGRETSAAYTEITGQPNLQPASSIKQPGVDTAIRYETFTTTGKAAEIYDALNNKTSRVFDANHWVSRSINARTFSTHYAYDDFGNVTSFIDALGNQTTKTYDVLGRLKTEQSPLGLVTTYTYDASGNIKSKNEQQGADINYTTLYEYDASDNLTKSTDPLNHVTTYVYDALNRKIAEHYSVRTVPHSRFYTYDALGRLSTVTNERNQTVATHYTERSKIKYKLDPLLNNTVVYTYDKSGNVASVTDAESRTISYEYDPLNRKTKATDDQNNYQQWTYNAAGQVKQLRDGRGRITTYIYDANGNLKQVTDPEGGITKSDYDKNGNVIKVTDAKGNSTHYSYDALDRRLSTTLNDGTRQWHYEYDANGNQTRAITPNNEVTVQTYDALNRVTQLTEYDASNAITRQVSYDYDANGNVLSETSAGQTISYTYDEINRISSVTDSFGKTIAYGYDKAGNRTSLTYPDNKTIQYSFDENDRLKSLTDWLNQTTTYDRHKNGQIKQVNNGNGSKALYTYDTAGRLINLANQKADSTVISSHAMTLDGAGNITQSSMDLPLLPSMPTAIATMTYDNNNRLLAADGDSYTHDDSGRIVREDANAVQTIYNFNVNDLITSITVAGVPQSSYRYDLNNNRISQNRNGVETRYVIDQLASLPNVVAETDDQGAILRYYLYGDGLVSQIDATGNHRYYHYDPTGHTLALSDATGNVSDTYAYSPYGVTSSTGTTTNPFRFVGKHGVMDDGNGLHYMRARFYDADIKRFLSLDGLHGDMVTPQALNRYAYVLGNPVMGIDPSGLEYECSGTLIGCLYSDASSVLDNFKLGWSITSKKTTEKAVDLYKKTKSLITKSNSTLKRLLKAKKSTLVEKLQDLKKTKKLVGVKNTAKVSIKNLIKTSKTTVKGKFVPLNIALEMETSNQIAYSIEVDNISGLKAVTGIIDASSYGVIRSIPTGVIGMTQIIVPFDDYDRDAQYFIDLINDVISVKGASHLINGQ